MKKVLGLLVVLGFAAAPAFAQKITIDYAHEFDFSKVKTFTYHATEDSNSKDQLMDGRIKDGIIKALTEDGLKQVDSEPDIYVTYHLSAKDKTVYNTSSFGYGGMHRGWGGWGGGMASSTTTASTFTEGTLILDAYDGAEKKMVWRGTGTVTLKEKPEKIAKQIENIMAKMGAKWDKILKNQGE
jgi:hypothetical protein